MDDQQGASWLGSSFLSPLCGPTTRVLVSNHLQRSLSLSWPQGQGGREEGGEQGVIYHCREMCCTQQGRLSSLLFLQPEPQILKRCRTCTSQITIHHRCSGSPGADPPDVRLTGSAFSPGPSGAGNTGTSQARNSCSGQSPSTTIY